MFTVQAYPAAVILCIISMISWGSSSNTQKLVSPTWRAELFCWDYVLGIVISSLLFALTLGSFGNHGRSFLPDIQQADIKSLSSAFLGGVIFNAANILSITAISLVGMSVAFSVGAGLALVIGVTVNYLDSPIGNVQMLFGGTFLIIAAILLNALALRRSATVSSSISSKGLIVSIGSGILMGLFFKYVSNSMFTNFKVPVEGKLSPYTAVFVFSIGVLSSSFIFNTILMRKPISGAAVSCNDYIKGSLRDHLLGIIGGIIWCIGMMVSIIASDKAGPAISYGLASGAVIVASIWGIFYWREFENAPKGTSAILNLMLLSFFLGLLLIVFSK